THSESGSGAPKGGSGGIKEVPDFPFVALIVSGGHTALLLVEDFTRLKVLGQTRDDSAGEAFDKVAKLMGLGYPGGVEIDRLAKQGDPFLVEFKRPIIAKGSLEFSFSGLKTAVLHKVKAAELTEDMKRHVAAGFQEAIVDVLVEKAMWAVEATGVKNLVCAGGVACNSRLRQRLSDVAGKNNIRLFIPPPRYCSDNGAMVAVSAYHIIKKKGDGASGRLSLNADPSLEF
ncbi:MAG: tRNA (adenosine(37)-N6)-threonylcarbamoyltransferase complex transferase subunit TsaD, partial [Thermodesulfobacteriota bacterium]